MTYDELDKEVLLIKKKGVTPFVEQNLIKQKRGAFYQVKITEDMLTFNHLIKRNLAFLERAHKVYCNYNNLKDFLGIEINHAYNDWYFNRHTMYYTQFGFYISYFFNIPMELLLFTDLEANERTIKEQYPLIFKQSRH